MTQSTTGDSRTTREKFRAWRKAHPDVTNERLLLSRGLWTIFLALSAWVGISQVRLDNKVTRERVDDALQHQFENCQATNARRDEGKQVALGAVSADQAALDSDMTTWQAIDSSIKGGIPEPLRTTVFSGLTARQQAIEAQRSLIDTVYRADDCPPPSVDTSTG